MAERSSSLQLEGAPDNASIAAWVGMCLYGTGAAFASAAGSWDFFLCSLAALLAPLIFEKIDILLMGEIGRVKWFNEDVKQNAKGMTGDVWFCMYRK